MSKLDHTLAQTFTTASGDKTCTITGCTVGQPIILIHEPKSSYTNGSAGHFCNLYLTSGCKGLTNGFSMMFGTRYWDPAGGRIYASSNTCLVIIPTETVVTFSTFEVNGSNSDMETIYIYKMQ